MLEERILRLRILVGFLGESNQYGFWSSSFFSGNSNTFLSPVFTKTQFVARVNGATKAASLLHDQRIGLGNVYHLFRLPEGIEQLLHHNLIDQKEDISKFIESEEGALEHLKKFGNKPSNGNAGPILIGDIGIFQHRDTLEKLASIYYHSFTSREIQFPYFSG